MVSVVKFGGTSLKDKACLIRVAGIIRRLAESEGKVIAVVSAQGDFTDTLVAKAHEISDCLSQMEMDALLASGEQISASLLAIVLNSIGIPARSLTAWQAGILTNNDFGSAKILSVDKTRLLDELDKVNVLVVTGFQGVSSDGDITTLGRGGSDTSAVAIAAAMQSPVCRIFTDVDGVFTADPRRISSARILPHLSYDTMIKMSSLGAGVLHDRCVIMARDKNVPLRVLSSIMPGAGTLIDDKITEHKGVSAVSVLSANDGTTCVSAVGRKLVSLGIVDSINYICSELCGSIVGFSEDYVSVTVPNGNAYRLEQILHKTFIE